MNPEEQISPQFKLRKIETSEDVRQFSQLLDLSFEVPKGWHFFDDFPVWSPRFRVPTLIRFGLFHKNELVAVTAVRVAQLKLKNGTPVKTGIIGAVATSPDWRGLGSASLLVKKACDWALRQGAQIALLWGSEHSLYSKLGFKLWGRQFVLPLATLGLSGSSGEPVQKGWQSGIFELIRKRQDGLLLQSRDLSWYGAHKNVEWFYTGRAVHPLAYVAFGRGIDLKGVIHEWGGKREEILRLFYFILQLHPTAMLLMGEDHLSNFGILPQAIQPEYLCMAKVLNSSQDAHSLELSKLSFWIWGLDAA